VLVITADHLMFFGGLASLELSKTLLGAHLFLKAAALNYGRVCKS